MTHVAGSPAGYSGTPLPRKLGIKPGSKVLLTTAGSLWVCWPKRASRVPTDMTENAVRDTALPQGWVDNKVCAIDATWSGLRLVLRVQNRPKSP